MKIKFYQCLGKLYSCKMDMIASVKIIQIYDCPKKIVGDLKLFKENGESIDKVYLKESGRVINVNPNYIISTEDVNLYKYVVDFDPMEYPHMVYPKITYFAIRPTCCVELIPRYNNSVDIC